SALGERSYNRAAVAAPVSPVLYSLCKIRFPSHISVIPGEAEKSRRDTFKLPSAGSLDYARDDYVFVLFAFVSFFVPFFSVFSIKRTFEIWIGPSRSAIFPLGLSCDFRKCFLIIRTPSISTRCFCGRT